MSRHYLQQSKGDVQAEDLVRATDDLAEALHAAIKAIAMKRAWRHDHPALRSAVVSQLVVELGPSTGADILFNGRSAGDKHSETYCKDAIYDDIVLYGIESIEALQQTIEQLMNQPPGPFTVAKPLDAHRINQLTGYEPALGATDAQGFANFTGQVREE